ncbi:MAG TPA: glycoside hydrolase family 2 TIM barrel-domain containing protein [Opitutaceae bacterium]|nr:glycoside hydrolase family 2 TIM barrel-domain containing protein [Opitutaceae bacterium]
MKHVIRSVTSLNGLWEFAFLGDIAPDAFSPLDLRCDRKLPVPSAFDALPAEAGRRGLAAYRTRCTVPPGRPARLEFGAVSIWARVYVDGRLLREHACGYAPFTVPVPVAEHPGREIVVLVDNRFDFERSPMHEERFDFYQYGGIIRDVALHLLPTSAPFFELVQVMPTPDYRSGRIGVRVELGAAAGRTMLLSSRIDDGPVTRHECRVSATGETTLALTVPSPRVWSPESPHLHVLRVTIDDPGLGAPLDDTEVRFGLRRIEARDGGLWLNGEPLRLRGYNRHEWHPNFGPCVPTLQMVADLELLRELGCNFVRGCHYPQDQRFLDLCDELGFLVWEENLGWGQREPTFASAKFKRDHAESLAAMVRASCNHPSVIIWGFLNEAGTDADYVRPLFEETAATLRRLDPSRLISYASMFPLTDRHFDLVDVISVNLYPGWYNCEGAAAPLEEIVPFIRRCFEHIDANGGRDKPVFISEIGAEALYGWRDAHRDFFTEEYQAEYLRRACREAVDNPRCSGIALWQFCDTRTYGGGLSLKRPRTFNNKGTFDEYRRSKLAFAAVREVFDGPRA